MRLPLLVSVPHAGIRVPPEVASNCLLTEAEIRADGDEGAEEIYTFAEYVEAFVATEIARAIIDLNRDEDDRSPDGVIKTETCWGVPVYRSPLSDDTIGNLLERYYRPYHTRLRDLSQMSDVRAGVDCHTMAAIGPPIGPLAGQPRPLICLSSADGTCPDSWITALAECLETVFDVEVSINHPFRGGHIIRSHAHELPWLQLELSRAPFCTNAQKRAKVLEALECWCDFVTR